MFGHFCARTRGDNRRSGGDVIGPLGIAARTAGINRTGGRGDPLHPLAQGSCANGEIVRCLADGGQPDQKAANLGFSGFPFHQEVESPGNVVRSRMLTARQRLQAIVKRAHQAISFTGNLASVMKLASTACPCCDAMDSG